MYPRWIAWLISGGVNNKYFLTVKCNRETLLFPKGNPEGKKRGFRADPLPQTPTYGDGANLVDSSGWAMLNYTIPPISSTHAVLLASTSPPHPLHRHTKHFRTPKMFLGTGTPKTIFFPHNCFSKPTFLPESRYPHFWEPKVFLPLGRKAFSGSESVFCPNTFGS